MERFKSFNTWSTWSAKVVDWTIMGMLESFNTWTTSDWRCDFIGLRIRDKELSAMSHDDLTGCGLLKFKLWHKMEDDGPIDWIERCAWLDVFVAEEGHNRGRISYMTIEEYSDTATADLHDHHRHYRSTRYRVATADEEQMSKDLLSTIVLNDSEEMACRLIGHIQDMEKTFRLQKFEIRYNRTYWNYDRSRLGEEMRIQELAELIKNAYNYLEIFFDAHFCKESVSLYDYDHIPLINMIDPEWFYQGMNITLKKKLCEDRIMKLIRPYLTLSNRSVDEERISIRAMIDYRLGKQRLRQTATEIFVRKESKVTNLELSHPEVMHQFMHPKENELNLLDSTENDSKNPLLEKIKALATIKTVINTDEDEVPF